MQDELEALWQEIIDDQLRLLANARRALPNLPVPYFAHMRLLRDDRPRDMLLGGQTLITSGINIVDWQDAPLAKVFFDYEEGEEYEVKFGDRTLVGTLRAVLPELASRASRASQKGEDRSAAHATREDLLHLWGDRELLERVVESSNGVLNPLMIQDVIGHTRVIHQVWLTSVGSWSPILPG